MLRKSPTTYTMPFDAAVRARTQPVTLGWKEAMGLHVVRLTAARFCLARPFTAVKRPPAYRTRRSGETPSARTATLGPVNDRRQPVGLPEVAFRPTKFVAGLSLRP